MDPKLTIERTPLRSRAIVSCGYSESLRVLDIEFRGGRVYRYYLVPKKAYVALLEARSKTRFIDEDVKGKYPFVRLAPEAPPDLVDVLTRAVYAAGHADPDST
jgi:hypothetical protein